MKRSDFKQALPILKLVLVLLGFSPLAVNAACEQYPLALQQMSQRSAEIVTNKQQRIKINYRVADTPALRSAGFQNVCASTIDKEQILFVFQRELIPAFHMRNVVAALDIAFIRADGTIANIQTMQPYVLGSTKRPLYQPQEAIVYVLETREGFFAEHNIIEEQATFHFTTNTN
ncbi:MAG: DUF192 domain-containing protein [Arenicella sp.]